MNAKSIKNRRSGVNVLTATNMFYKEDKITSNYIIILQYN